MKCKSLFLIGSMITLNQHPIEAHEKLDLANDHRPKMYLSPMAKLHRQKAYVSGLTENNDTFKGIFIQGSINGYIDTITVRDGTPILPNFIKITMKNGEEFTNTYRIDIHSEDFDLTSTSDPDNVMRFFVKSIKPSLLKDHLDDFLRSAVFGGTELSQYSPSVRGDTRGYNLEPDPISGIASICDSTGLIIGTVGGITVSQDGPQFRIFLTVGEQEFTNTVDTPTDNGTFELHGYGPSKLVFQLGSNVTESMNTAEKFAERLNAFFNSNQNAFLSPNSGATGGHTGFEAIKVDASATPGLYSWTYQPHSSGTNGMFHLLNGKEVLQQTIVDSGKQTVSFPNGITIVLGDNFNIAVPLSIRTFDIISK